MRRSAHHTSWFAAVPMVLLFFGALFRKARRLGKRPPVPGPMVSKRLALRPDERAPGRAGWIPEPGAERASVLGYQRVAPAAAGASASGVEHGGGPSLGR